MKTRKIGIIGYGGFGQFLYHSWSALEDVCVTALADQQASRLEGLDQVRTYARWQDMLQEELDVVAIVTSPDTHARIATACMEAGKHVWIEKPLAIDPGEAREVIRARDTHQRAACIDFLMRFNPLLLELRRFAQEKTFGELRRVSVENYAQDETLPAEHWFWQAERSGGILIEHGVHFIDLVHFLCPARPLRVNGLKHDRKPGMEDQIMANVMYEGGLVASHYHAFSRPGFFETTKIKLAFDLADIELSGWIPLVGRLRGLVRPETRESLLGCPFFELTDSRPVGQILDLSRPKGWGPSAKNKPAGDHSLRSGGRSYEISELVQGTLQIGRTKEEVYRHCVQAGLRDLIKKVDDPAHRLVAPLEAGLASLEIASKATASARS